MWLELPFYLIVQDRPEPLRALFCHTDTRILGGSNTYICLAYSTAAWEEGGALARLPAARVFEDR